MTGSSRAAGGFGSRAIDRSRLKSAVAIAVAIGLLSFGLIVAVIALSIKVAAMPLLF